MERTERLLSLGANPLLGRDQFNHNALHRMALVCTKADYSNILSLINDKVSANIRFLFLTVDYSFVRKNK